MTADRAPAGSLAEMVRSYLDDPEVALRPADPTREARLNTWGYGLDGRPVDVEATVAALDAVRRGLADRLADQPHPGTFYAWYDDQTGQLRCSLSSAAPDGLPFGEPYRVTGDAAEIVAAAAADPQPGWVAFDELTEVTGPTGDGEVPHPPFPVWAVAVR
ncbi:hypothetical protein [Catellatospora methionotrophica]|uniref:hypothetical protein n=1 Tax=Catellatospora methionotrophica TaxID=121620 RepID=UPI0033FDEC5E